MVRKVLPSVITAIIVITCSVLGFVAGPGLDSLQTETLKILLTVCGCSALYCFVVGEISRNNSQMDKLWSILPEVYIWITAIKGGMTPRLVVMAVLATLWGIRLTYNFAKKGAYSIKFWSGEEDYRWVALRKKKYFSNRFVWALFDLFFISIYQNALVLATTLPAVAVMNSSKEFCPLDIIPIVLVLGFLTLETVADAQQMKFQTTKWSMINSGKKLEELPAPYNKGFNTQGLWSRFRHPNYLGEQAIWISMYLFTVPAGVTSRGVFNWSLFGGMFLVLLFMGSSTLSESFSSKKYPEYNLYCKQLYKYLPFRKYKG